jgi:hypothetical protein
MSRGELLNHISKDCVIDYCFPGRCFKSSTKSGPARDLCCLPPLDPFLFARHFSCRGDPVHGHAAELPVAVIAYRYRLDRLCVDRTVLAVRPQIDGRHRTAEARQGEVGGTVVDFIAKMPGLGIDTRLIGVSDPLLLGCR